MANRILIVEDDTPIRELVTSLLRDVGYDVLTTTNGVAALEALQGEAQFDLILLDMGLPLMSGRELAQQMANHGIEVPILVMTAGRDARRAAHEIGAIGYIAKPFDIDELERAVRVALEGGADVNPRSHFALPQLRGLRRARPLGDATPPQALRLRRSFNA
jgi:DNA-binding response OmpR family regulator